MKGWISGKEGKADRGEEGVRNEGRSHCSGGLWNGQEVEHVTQRMAEEAGRY